MSCSGRCPLSSPPSPYMLSQGTVSSDPTPSQLSHLSCPTGLQERTIHPLQQPQVNCHVSHTPQLYKNSTPSTTTPSQLSHLSCPTGLQERTIHPLQQPQVNCHVSHTPQLYKNSTPSTTTPGQLSHCKKLNPG